MRVLVHDFSGHPFQAQLSRELSRRGHDVTHSTCEAWVTGKGRLEAGPGERITFDTIGRGVSIEKAKFGRRLLTDLRLGRELARHVRSVRPDVALISNVQVPALVVFAASMLLSRIPWVLWHQDLYGVALRSLVGAKLPRWLAPVATAFEVGERWTSRRAAAIVTISSAFMDVHEQWGTSEKATVIPNWAPLDEITPRVRTNAWSAEQDLDDVFTIVYSGTLGLKHNPALLVQLAAEVRDRGRDVQLVVVNEGPAVEAIQAEAARLDVSVRLLPFQPYDRLPEVLATGDLLVVLLDQEAGAFSVPSKTLSYLCAGRPILGLVPDANLAAELIVEAGGFVARPDASSLPEAAAWVDTLIDDADYREKLGRLSRELAEREFELARCADGFESILAGAARVRRARAARPARETAAVEHAISL